jgi:hypothetical protein
MVTIPSAVNVRVKSGATESIPEIAKRMTEIEKKQQHWPLARALLRTGPRCPS